MKKITISVKEASELSNLPATFIRKQVENHAIPKAYAIQNTRRKSYVIYRSHFIEWLKEIRGSDCV